MQKISLMATSNQLSILLLLSYKSTIQNFKGFHKLKKTVHTVQPHASLSMIPQKPHAYLVHNDEKAGSMNPIEDELSSWKMDLSKMGEELSDREQKREIGYRISKQIQSALSKARNSMEYGGNDPNLLKHEKELDSIVIEHMTEPESEMNAIANNDNVDSINIKNKEVNILLHSDNTPRISNLGYTMEDFVRFKAFRYFLSTGRLLPFSKINDSINSITPPNIRVRDDEYLGGACILLSHDLSRYAVGRAIVRDVQSVQLARDLVEQCKFFRYINVLHLCHNCFPA